LHGVLWKIALAEARLAMLIDISMIQARLSTVSGGTRKPIARGSLPGTGDRPYDPEIRRLLPLYDIGGRPYFGYRMVLAARLFDRRIIEVLAETGGLTLPQWRVLAQLGLLSSSTVRSMADGAAVDRAEVSRATRELMRLGLVSRQENGADKRSPTFALTAAGKKSFVKVRKPIGKFIEHMVDGLDAKDLEAANKVLWAITKGCLQR
jgi:DNA-binding MarR family transcriptional regulator